MLEKVNFEEKRNVITNVVFCILSLLIVFLPMIQFIMKLEALCELFFIYVLLKGFFRYGFKNSVQIAKDGKNRKLFLIFLVILPVSLVVLLHMKCETHMELYMVFLGVSAILLTGFLAIFFYCVVWKKKIEKTYSLLLIALGFSFMIVIPIGLVPDEGMHSFTSYRISNRFLGIKDNEETTLMRESDSSFALISESSYYTNRRYENYFLQMDEADVKNNLIETEIPYVTGTDCLYIIPALGITLARLIRLNSIQMYMFGRIFNFFFYLAGMFFLLNKTKYKKNVLIVLSLLPVFIQQGMSISYDVPINLMMFLIITFTVNLNHDSNSLTNLDKFLLLISCLLMCKVKSHAYILIGLLPVLCFIWKKINDSKHKKIIWTSLVLFLLAGIVSVFLLASKMPSQNLNDGDYYTILFLLQNPREIFAVVFNSMMESGDFFIDSFVGRYLGYLNIPVHPLFIYAFYILIAFVVVPNENETYEIPGYEKGTFYFSGIMTAIFTFAGMLIACSRIGEHKVLGMQGRYLLPSMYMLFLLINPKFIHSNSSLNRVFVIFTFLLNFMVILNVMLIL